MNNRYTAEILNKPCYICSPTNKNLLSFQCFKGIYMDHMSSRKKYILLPQPKLFQIMNVPDFVEKKYLEYQIKKNLQIDFNPPLNFSD